MTPLVDLILARIREGKLPEAEEAIDLLDDELMALRFRGGVALRRRDWLAAHDLFQRALSFDRNHRETLLNLGDAQFELGLFKQAEKSFEALVMANIDDAKAWHKYGAVMASTARWPEALACVERSVAMDPEDAQTNQTMGMLLSTLCLDEGAQRYYREALRLLPGYAHAECGLAATLLRSGQWLEGWKHFESRWRLPNPIAPWWYRGQQLYDGDLEGLRGKRLLLRSEQGYGDSIMFARYIEPLSKIAGSIVLETQAELARLFSCLPCEIVIAPKMENQVRAIADIPFDAQTSLMSLPLLFETTAETVPLPARFRTDFTRPSTFVPWVGVCWSGGPRPEDPQAHAVDARRSFTRDEFRPVIDAIGNSAVSFQAEHVSARTRGCGETFDWQHTANNLMACDLVITVDTAVAHLAASLGIEVWLLSRFDNCWRWPTNNERTPWYQTMRIFRQPQLGDWRTVIERVVNDLKERG